MPQDIRKQFAAQASRKPRAPADSPASTPTPTPTPARPAPSKTSTKAPATATTPSTASGASTPTGATGATGANNDGLWTVKHAPTTLKMLCGNKAPVERLQTWLHNWRANAKSGFKKAGKDGSGIYRSVMVHGPPGIGKTTAAHLVAQAEGYDVVETNASDTRSKGLLERGLASVLDTQSLQGYFSSGGGAGGNGSKRVEKTKRNLVLIMDEVDGMSAGDRGGVGALAAIAKKTKIPIIMICNERGIPKMRPFNYVVFEVPFRRPTADQIRARLSTICFREGMKIPPPVLDALIEGSHADIRQLINMLSAAKLDQQSQQSQPQSMDVDSGKEMSKRWQKNIILKPWDITLKIMSGRTFAPESKMSLNEKIELYFNDYEFSPLMLQENYLKSNPAAVSQVPGGAAKQKMKALELAEAAAESISDADLVDRMIHGTQQQWSLMPTHAVFSFVRPASFMAGKMSEKVTFTSWLGNNSKQNKLVREVKEIQGHMRLRAAADRHDIRLQYLPSLWNMIPRRLMDEGKDSVSSVIDLMDSYYLTREDYDSLVELGIGPMDEQKLTVSTQTKAAFTRIYNQRSHPVPFMAASTVVAPKKAAKEKPDIEDALDASDEGEDIPADAEVKEDEGEELDLKKDKYVKLPKKTAQKGGAANKGQKRSATGGAAGGSGDTAKGASTKKAKTQSRNSKTV